MQVTERIHIVASGMHGFGMSHPSDCHVYLVDGGTELALIDAGAGVSIEPIRRTLDALGVSDRVRHLFVTHAHADHAGGASVLRRSLNLELVTSPEVASILREGSETGASVDIGKAQGTYQPEYEFAATPVDREGNDGDRIKVGDLEVELVATPGHAIGHLSFLVHARGRTDLFTGDMLLFGGQIILQNTWDCDLKAHLQSVTRLGQHRFEGFFPGHWTFSVTDGERHVRTALDALAHGAIPPTIR